MVWEDVHEARRDQPRAWGATFFHGQDVERGVHGKGLLLAFGAFATGEAHEPESLKVARETCDTLTRFGVPNQWNGSIGARIRDPALRVAPSAVHEPAEMSRGRFTISS